MIVALELRLHSKCETIGDGEEGEDSRGEDAARIQLRLHDADPGIDEVVGIYEGLRRECQMKWSGCNWRDQSAYEDETKEADGAGRVTVDSAFCMSYVEAKIPGSRYKQACR